ncbi:Dos2-interacting transcription regulator of RNA-Pol-II-domain-containing protein [Cladochytrium replicatum]|nr:Dos2-interacting transcription regulator of RNA-Pol-II-domain-containing protein [Cladochytrium replicatum]
MDPSFVAEDVNSGALPLLKLVETLGPQLTSSEPYTRAKGVEILSTVLAQCNSNVIDKSTGSVLLSFFVDRLHDKASVPELAKGILALLKLKVVAATDALAIPKGIFAELDVQSYPQNVRYQIYSIFEQLVTDFKDALKQSANDVINGFIVCMDGEKDPRNLMSCFRIVTVLGREILPAAAAAGGQTMEVDGGSGSTKLAEDLFEVVFCYFPITFKPPPDDVYGITAEELRIALRNCLASSPQFAPQAMALFIEKLRSTSLSAKKDAMDALAHCMPAYGAAAIDSHIRMVWSLVRDEIYVVADDTLLDDALNVVGAICTTLVQFSVEDFDRRFLALVVQEAREAIVGGDERKFAAVGKILERISITADRAIGTIVSALFPVILSVRSSSGNNVARQQALVDVIYHLLRANRRVYGSVQELRMELDSGVSPITQYSDTIFSLLCEPGPSQPLDFRRTCVNSLVEVLLTPEFLKAEQTKEALHWMGAIAISETTHEDLKKVVINGLCEIASGLPEEIKVHVATPVLAELKLADDKSGPGLVSLITRISGSHPELFKFSLPLLFDSITPENADVVLGGLRNLLEARVNKDEWTGVDGVSWNNIASAIGMKLVAALLGEATGATEAASALRVTMRNLSEKEQESLLLVAFGTLEGKVDTALGRSVVVREILGNLRPHVPIPVPNVSHFVDSLLATALESSPIVAENLAAGGASCLNKQGDAAQLVRNLESYILTAARVAKSNPGSVSPQQVIVATWVAKAYIIQSKVDAYQVTDLLFDVLSGASDEDGGLLWSTAASGFGTILGDERTGLLTKSSFASVKPLFKQRFFEHCFKGLMSFIGGSVSQGRGDMSIRRRGLYALVHLAQNTPRTILKQKLAEVVPKLVESLQQSQSTTKQAAEIQRGAVDGLQFALKESPESVVAHVSSAVAALLDCTKSPSVHTRIAALQCLGLLTSTVKYETLHPHKQIIIKRLGDVLDDPKRVVRKEAVNARSKYFLFMGGS